MGLTTVEYIILYGAIALVTIIFYKLLSSLSKIVMFVFARSTNNMMKYQENLIFQKKRAERRTGDRRIIGDRRSKPRFLYCRNVFASEINDRRVADRRHG